MAAWLDHLVLAVPDLDAASAHWRDAGHVVDVGGEHPGGTHNALVRSPQRCYVELLAARPDATSPWAERVREVDGPLAWAVGVDDLDAALAAVAELGLGLGLGPESVPVPVVAGSRTTPDGGRLAWRTANLGPYPMHPHLPFLIEWQVGMPPAPLGAPVRSVVLSVPAPGEVAAVLAAVGFARVDGLELTDGEVVVRLEAGTDGLVELLF